MLKKLKESKIFHDFCSYLGLFASLSTLFCCALPATFVALGMGAAFAGILSKIPQLIWFSVHKNVIFSLGGLFLFVELILQLIARNLPCPIDPKLRELCLRSRKRSFILYIFSIVIYLIGFISAFVLPLL